MTGSMRPLKRLANWLRKPRLDAVLQEKEERWEQHWEVEKERPVELLASTVPTEVKEAVRTGWIAPGAHVMDIGSGRGQISAWLAEQGCTVLGADLAEAATELARRHFAHLAPRLDFRTLDICVDEPEPARFDALVDRGCFQGVPDELEPRYVEQVARWAKPGAGLLLFHRVGRLDLPPAELTERMAGMEQRFRDLFAPSFDLCKAAPTAEPMERSAGPIPRVVRAGMVCWMVRR